jgi:predicted RNase H-like nuclease
MVVGVDGCRAGWVAVAIDKEKDSWQVNVFPDIFSLWHKYGFVGLIILVDIPIGLKDEGDNERLCDITARKLLGYRRAASVFPVPCRPAVYAETYIQATRINYQLTHRRLSVQTWNIVPKIREVDMLLIDKGIKAMHCIRETHPEICFWALASYQPMKYPKKERYGILERVNVLKKIYPYTEDIINHTMNTYKRYEVALDDIIDALAIAVTGMIGNSNNFVSIPEGCPEYDSKGLRMEIVYSRI